MNRRAPSDLWLWLVVILPTISAAMACFKLQAVFILAMLFGLALLECGRLPDAKFAQVLARYAGCAFVTTVPYMLVGYSMMFDFERLLEILRFKEAAPVADQYQGVYGAITWESVSPWTKISYQASFCLMGGLILAAGFTREVRPLAQLALCSVWAVAVYPTFGAWSWGLGWLGRRGFHDFAGGTVVYSLAGWSVLGVLAARAWSIRPMRTDAHVLTKNHRPWLYACGVVLLSPALALFELFEPSESSELVVAINLAAALGAIAASVVGLAVFRCWRMQFVFVGCWAAMAAVSAVPGPPLVGTIAESLLSGSAAGSLSVVALWFVDKLRIPDRLGVISACGVGGACGTVAVGFIHISPGTAFIHIAPGSTLGPVTLTAQLIGVATAFVFAFGVFGGITWAALYLHRKRTENATHSL